MPKRAVCPLFLPVNHFLFTIIFFITFFFTFWPIADFIGSSTFKGSAKVAGRFAFRCLFTVSRASSLAQDGVWGRVRGSMVKTVKDKICGQLRTYQ